MKQQKNSRRQASSQQNPNASSKAKFDRLSVRCIAKRAERVRAALQQRLIDHADVAAIWEGIGRAVDEKMVAAIPKWFSGFEVSAMRYRDGMLLDV
jgi:hypothetical protein